MSCSWHVIFLNVAGLSTNSIFSVSFLICLEGKSMTPRPRDTFLFRSSQQHPGLRLSRTLEGLFELAPRLSTRLVRCFWNYRESWITLFRCSENWGDSLTRLSTPAGIGYTFYFDSTSFRREMATTKEGV